MEKIITQNKTDIKRNLVNIRHSLQEIQRNRFSCGIVTVESWENSPTARISFRKNKIPMLKAAGVMKDPKDFEYGWHWPNVVYAQFEKELSAADKLLAEILMYLDDYNIIPKRFKFTDVDKSMFRVIEGGNQDYSFLFKCKGGDINA